MIILSIFIYTNRGWGEKKIIYMDRAGELDISVSIVDETGFNIWFNARSDIIYFYTDKNLKIRDIFVSNIKEGLKKWIKNIIGNT